MDDDGNFTEEDRQKMISSFTEILSSSRNAAEFVLGSHQYDLDSAVSAFNLAILAASAAKKPSRPRDRDLRLFAAPTQSPSPSRSSRQTVRRTGNFRTLADISGETDEQELDPMKAESSSSSSRTTLRSLSELRSVTAPQVIPQVVTIWRNAFTLEDDPSFDDPENAVILEVVESLESPHALVSPGGKIRFFIKFTCYDEDFSEESPEPFQPFQGVARTLADPPASSDSLSIDPTAPTTWIQLRLADGTRIVRQFNTHHTIRDVRDVIDAATPDGTRDYQLLIMGCPPKSLTDLDQTIEQASISNSALTQKL